MPSMGQSFLQAWRNGPRQEVKVGWELLRFPYLSLSYSTSELVASWIIVTSSALCTWKIL